MLLHCPDPLQHTRNRKSVHLFRVTNAVLMRQLLRLHCRAGITIIQALPINNKDLDFICFTWPKNLVNKTLMTHKICIQYLNGQGMM